MVNFISFLGYFIIKIFCMGLYLIIGNIRIGKVRMIFKNLEILNMVLYCFFWMEFFDYVVK